MINISNRQWIQGTVRVNGERAGLTSAEIARAVDRAAHYLDSGGNGQAGHIADQAISSVLHDRERR